MNPTKLLVLAVVLVFALVGCGQDPPLSVGTNNPADGDENAAFDCTCEFGDEVRVETCDGEDICETQDICGETVLCAQRPNCANPGDLPSCRTFQVEVDSCVGRDHCESYYEYCGEIDCQLGPVDVAGYGQDCTKPSDCVAVRDGDACDCSSCPRAAIEKDFEELYASVTEACDEDCSTAVCDEDLVTSCVSNVCAVREAQRVSADDFDRTCTVDTDCVAVFEGEICEECQCPNAAVNRAELASYQAQFDETCASDAPCPCAGAGSTCVDGVCEGP